MVAMSRPGNCIAASPHSFLPRNQYGSFGLGLATAVSILRVGFFVLRGWPTAFAAAHNSLDRRTYRTRLCCRVPFVLGQISIDTRPAEA
jgi:hypothetical protein